MDKYILPKFGHILLADLDAEGIETWISKLELSSQSRNHIHTSFNLVLKEAKKKKYIKHNPMDDVERAGITWQETGALTVAELAQLFPKEQEKLLDIWKGDPNAEQRWQGRLNSVEPRGLYWSAFFMLMATSGMRGQELRALQWQAIRIKKTHPLGVGRTPAQKSYSFCISSTGRL